MVTVHVKLFATLRKYLSAGIGEAVPVELPEEATVGLLIEHLGLPPDAVQVVFVNGIVQGEDHALEEGDEVGIFPPVGGG